MIPLHPPIPKIALPVNVAFKIAVAGEAAGPVRVSFDDARNFSVLLMLYVPAPKTINAQLGALEIVLCSVLWLMPLFRFTVGPPQPTGAGPTGPLVGPLGGFPGGFAEDVTVSEVCAVADA